MKRVLVLEDESAIREFIAINLERGGYEVIQAENGAQAIAQYDAAEGDIDVAVLDIMMPRMDGFTACKEIRREKDIPVLMLSARAEEYDKLHGFDLGIDDYVTKPFSPKEVLARLQVIVSRHKAAQGAPAPGQHEVYRDGALLVDMTARVVEIGGRRVDMAPKEYDLLFYLIRNKNIALSRDRLLSQVWGYDFFGEDSTVNTHIKVLRQRLGPYEKHIVTIRGVGYRWDGQTTEGCYENEK